MKSAKHRDDMVTRVKAAHAEYPTFDKLPLGGERSNSESKVFTWPINESDGDAAYVKALYEISFRGGVPIGRIDALEDEPAQIIGEVVAESAAADYSNGGIVISTYDDKE